MGEFSEHELNRLVGLVRRRADVPRVRSTEIRKIVLAMQSLAREGEAQLVATS